MGELSAKLEKIFREAVSLCDAERLTGAALVRDGETLEVYRHAWTTAIGADGRPTPRLAAKEAQLGISLSGGKVSAIVAGKAAPGMARAIHAALRDRFDRGILILPEDMETGAVPPGFEVARGSHPIPDAGSITAARKALALAQSLPPEDMLVCGISGGTSALMSLPWEGLSQSDTTATTRLLLRSGADIVAINSVRKHLSAIKGGRLAAATRASVLGLLLSDVAGDPPDVIGSGPVSPDPTTFADALGAIERWCPHEAVPSAVRSHLEAGVKGQVEETPKAEHPCFTRVRTAVLAGPEHLRQASIALAAQAGFAGAGTEPVSAGQEVEGLAVHLGKTARTAREHLQSKGHPQGSRAHLYVWVREPSVTVKGEGSGGRNGHLALLVAREIAGLPGVAFLAAGSDGVDGNTRAAGAAVDGDSWKAAVSRGLDPAGRLSRFDSGPVHDELGGAIVTGRTGTNFMDLQLLAVE